MGRWEALATGPRMIVIGELLLVLCSLCYLIWWASAFRPSVRMPPGGGIFLAGAVLGGFGGLLLLGAGIASLLPKASLAALGGTVLSGVLVGAGLLYVTSKLADRPVTTELPLIIVWATVQLAAGITVWTAGVVRAPVALAWIVATAVATVVGLICYLVFYRLDPIPAYWIGMVPLALDGVVAAILAAMVTFGRAP